jgi:hypothetical protein
MKPSLLVPFTFIVFFTSARVAHGFTTRPAVGCVEMVQRSTWLWLANASAYGKADHQKVPFDFSTLPSSMEFVPPWKSSIPFICEDTWWDDINKGILDYIDRQDDDSFRVRPMCGARKEARRGLSLKYFTRLSEVTIFKRMLFTSISKIILPLMKKTTRTHYRHCARE